MTKEFLTKKNVLALVGLLLVAVVLPVATVLVQQRQETRKKAAGCPLGASSRSSVRFVNTSGQPITAANINDKVRLEVNVGAVDAADIVLGFNNGKLEFDTTFGANGIQKSNVGGLTHFGNSGAVDLAPGRTDVTRILFIVQRAHGATATGGKIATIGFKVKTNTASDTTQIIYGDRTTLALNGDGGHLECGTGATLALNSAPTNTPVPTATPPSAPSNRITAPSCTTSREITLTLSASPAPGSAPAAGKGNTRILSNASASLPDKQSWGPEHCSAMPVGSEGILSCITYSNTFMWDFFGSAGQKYVWAIFYNDSGSDEAKAYWGTNNGWSKPVSVAVNYADSCPGPTNTPVPTNTPGPTATPTTPLPTATPTVPVGAASFNLVPGSSQVGSSFTLNVRLDPGGISTNNFKIAYKFDGTKLDCSTSAMAGVYTTCNDNADDDGVRSNPAQPDSYIVFDTAGGATVNAATNVGTATFTFKDSNKSANITYDRAADKAGTLKYVYVLNAAKQGVPVSVSDYCYFMTGGTCGPTGTPTPTIGGPTATPTPTVPACTKSTFPDAAGAANGDPDGRVDLLDFQRWREEFTGGLTTKTADFNCPPNGVVDLLDFNIWREYFVGHQ